MKIGICTTDFDRTGADALFQRIAELGYQSVQLSLDSVLECGFEASGQCEFPDRIPDDAIRIIQDASARHRLPIVCVNGTFNMAHPDGAVRSEGVRRFAGLARITKALGCGSISLCTGTREPSYLWEGHPDNGTQAAWRDMMECMRAVVGIAREHQLTLLIETEASNVIDTAEKARRVMDEIGSPFLKVVLDAANLFHAGQAYPDQVEGVLRNAVEVFGSDIALAHGKDIKAGSGIAFCGAGQGIVDFDLMLRLLGQLGYVGDMMLHGIFDQPQMTRSLAFMRQRIDAAGL